MGMEPKISQKEFKMSTITDTKCLQDEDQLDQVAWRSGQNIMSDFYSSNDVTLLPRHQRYRVGPKMGPSAHCHIPMCKTVSVLGF